MQIKQISFTYIIIAGLLSILLLSFTEVKHPYYISLTEIRIDTTTKNIQISCRMFTDDLQDALYRNYDFKKELIPGEADQPTQIILDKYIQERLKVIVGKEIAEVKIIGYEVEEESTWCFFEGSIKSNATKITVKNSLLYDFLPGQVNMIHCYLQKSRKSYKLNNPEKYHAFEF
jgi:hypothetical protein